MDWLDSHSGSVQALATLVLVALTGYYAYASRALVRETHTTLQANARAMLQARMDRISELCIQNPDLMSLLEQTDNSDAMDARFYFTNMFLGVLEEAHTQYAIDRTMPEDDWSAWAATSDTFLGRPYFAGYWRRVQGTYEPSFTRFVNDRLRECDFRKREQLPARSAPVS
jgi:hypothetical protein